MPVEESEKTAVHLTLIAMLVVLAAGGYRLLQIGLNQLDLTGSMFFIFTLAIATVSLALAFRNARYAALLAATALFLSMLVFGACVLGWRLLGLTC
ncbi:MAG: hypothetical protein QXJ55_08115 [Candidatus Caldarchaeum sp.]